MPFRKPFRSRLAKGLVISTAFVVARLLVLWSAPLDMYNIEESCNGAIALEFASGPCFHWTEYPYDLYAGGSLVVGVALIPFFRLLGPSFPALKLLALSWSLLSFLVWLSVYRRVLGKAGAAVCAWWWVFAPLAFQQHNLMAWGNHMESILFSGLAFLCLLTATTERGAEQTGRAASKKGGLARRSLGQGGPRGVPRSLLLFACGACLSVSLFFSYLAAPACGVCLLLWVRVGRKRRAAQAGLLALGFAAGILPWIIINASWAFRGLLVYGRPVWAHADPSDPRAAALKAALFMTRDLPRFLVPGLDVFAPRVVPAVLFAVVFLAVAVCMVRRLSRFTPAAIFPLHAALFLVLYGVADLSLYPESSGIYAYRFITPLFPFLVGMVGAGLAACPRLRPTLVLPALVFALSCVGAFLDNRPDLLAWTSYRGYTYRLLGHNIGYRHFGNPAGELERASAIPDSDDRRAFQDGLAFAFSKQIWDRWSTPLGERPITGDVRARGIGREVERIESMPEAVRGRLHRAVAAEMIFRAARRELTLEAGDGLARAIASLPPDSKRWYAGAAAGAAASAAASEAPVSGVVPAGVEDAAEAARGVGLVRGLRARFSPDEDPGPPADPGQPYAYYAGVGEMLARFTPLPYAADPAFPRVPARFRAAYACGALARIASLRRGDPAWADDARRWFLLSLGLDENFLGCPEERAKAADP